MKQEGPDPQLLALLAPYLDPSAGLKQVAALQQMDVGQQRLGLEGRRVDALEGSSDLAQQQFAEQQRIANVNQGFKEQEIMQDLARIAETTRSNQTREALASERNDIARGGLDLRQLESARLEQLLGGMGGGSAQATDPGIAELLRANPEIAANFNLILEQLKQNQIQLPQ